MKYLIGLFCLNCFHLYAIVGTYDVTGYDPYENKPYRGTCEIKRIDDIVYTAIWTEEDGDTYKGTGLKTDDYIAFVYINRDLGSKLKLIGLQTYTIEGTTLNGSWVFMNESTVGTERLIKR